MENVELRLAPRSEASVGVAQAPPLIGRQKEMRSITAALNAAAIGQANCLVVRGSAGIGKSRLIEAARDEASGRGFQAVICHAVQQMIERPLAPLLESELGDSVLRGTGTQPASAPAIAPASGWFLLADQLFGAIESRCAAGPLLLVLENAHWADPETLACRCRSSSRTGRSTRRRRCTGCSRK